MRLSAADKLEIIQLVDRSEVGVNRTLRELGIHKSTFYKWYQAYCKYPYKSDTSKLENRAIISQLLIRKIAHEEDKINGKSLEKTFNLQIYIFLLILYPELNGSNSFLSGLLCYFRK